MGLASGQSELCKKQPELVKLSQPYGETGTLCHRRGQAEQQMSSVRRMPRGPCTSSCTGIGWESDRPRPTPAEEHMRATLIHGPRDIRVEDCPDPVLLADTDAIVRVTAACVCGSDLWPYRGVNPTRSPGASATNSSGLVEAVGQGHHAGRGRLRGGPLGQQLRHLPALPRRRPGRLRAPGLLGRQRRKRAARRWRPGRGGAGSQRRGHPGAGPGRRANRTRRCPSRCWRSRT